MVKYTELNFDLELSPSVLASSSEESVIDTEVSCDSSNCNRTVVTSNRKRNTITRTRKRGTMDDEFDDDQGVSYDQWCSVNLDLPPSQVEVVVPAEGGDLEDSDEEESVCSSGSVDLGDFSASSSLASSCDLSPDELARICIMGETGANLTEAQRVKFLESHENTEKYEKSKTDLFATFLEIIGEKGGKLLRLGTETVEYQYRQVPALVKALNTAKNRSTRVVILDECLKLFAEFYRRDDGSMYAPGSLKTFYKRLFATLRLDFNVDVKVKYFAKKGSFRSVSTVNMQEARAKSKEYGIQKGMSNICINDVEIVYSALAERKLVPRENPYHLKLLISFILLRLYGLRASEVSNLEVDEVSFETYDHGPDRGKKFCQLKMDFDKTHKLKFGTGGIPKGYGKLKIRNNEEDGVFNAYYFMEFYFGKLQVGSRTRRFLRRPIGRANFEASSESVWYNCLVVSKEAVTNTYRELQTVIGEPAATFREITAHGGRACLVTYSLAHGVTTRALMQQTRHMNESGLIPYKRVDHCTAAVFQDVLDGVFPKGIDGMEKKAGGEICEMKEKKENKEEGNAHLDRKPAALNAVSTKEGRSTEEGTRASNVNSTSAEADIVKQLQQEIIVLKGKMEDSERGTECAASPSKKAKTEAVAVSATVGRIKDESGVASSIGIRDSLMYRDMMRENDEMRRMLMRNAYENETRLGFMRQSPFPSSNSGHLQQFSSNEFVSPYGGSVRQQSDLPQGYREDRLGLNGNPIPEQRPQPDTSPVALEGNERREEGNGRRDGGSVFPSITVPCVIM